MYSIAGDGAAKVIAGARTMYSVIGAAVAKETGAGATFSITEAGSASVTVGAGVTCSITGEGAVKVAAGADATYSVTDARWAPHTRSLAQVFCVQQQERRLRASVSVGRSKGLARAGVCVATAIRTVISSWRRKHRGRLSRLRRAAPPATGARLPLDMATTRVLRTRRRNRRTHFSKTFSSNSTFSPRCDFMTFWQNSFQTFSCGLRSFHNACMLCLLDFVGTFGFVVSIPTN